jgi:predicted RNA binding protein YcfA (HicA-like mRNA interferase family)
MMTQRDKLLAKIQKNPKAVTFHELDTLLRQHGFEITRVTGSHYRYSQRGMASITVALHRPHIHYLTVRDALNAVEQARSAEQTQLRHEREDNGEEY